MTKDGVNFQGQAAEAGLRLVSERSDAPNVLQIEKQFANFMFLRVRPEWRRLSSETKQSNKADFCNAFEAFKNDLLLFSYSLVGFDSKADIMLWRVGNSLDLIQDMTTRLYRTQLGAYIETADNYLSVTKKMMFVDDGAEDRRHVRPGTTKYHFVYPCAKHRDWYQMSVEERENLIEENFMVGKKFPNIKIHLTHAFGFNEHEYLISFETDEPKDFIALAEELRQTPASKYTLRGMPIYTCRQRTIEECIDALG